MLIDTHCHLNFKAFNKDLPQVITRAKEVEVEKIIIPGAKIDSSKKAVEIAQKYPSCYAAVGIHPRHVANYSSLAEISSLIKQPKVVAIGEIGLDYYRYPHSPSVSKSDKQIQKKLFCLQLELAVKTNLPVIIHCRNAHDDLLDLLKSFLKDPKKKLKGVFHCFNGERKHLKQALDLGFYIGFDGNITYQENSHLQSLVKYTQPDRLLLETDSPFLAPLPFRGNRNEPVNLSLVASFIASLHKKKISEISRATSSSALKLFNL